MRDTFCVISPNAVNRTWMPELLDGVDHANRLLNGRDGVMYVVQVVRVVNVTNGVLRIQSASDFDDRHLRPNKMAKTHGGLPNADGR